MGANASANLACGSGTFVLKLSICSGKLFPIGLLVYLPLHKQFKT